MEKRYKLFNDHFVRRSVTLLAALVLLSAAGFAQEAKPTPTPRPEEALVAKLRQAINDPAQTVAIVLRLVNEFPESQAAESAGYSFASALRRQAKLDNDPAKLRALADRFLQGTASAPPQLRVRINSRAVSAMLDNSLTEQAVEVALQTIPLLEEEQEYLAHERKQYENTVGIARKRDVNYKPRPFDEKRASSDFRVVKVSYYTSLGRGYLKLGKIEAAEEAYKTAYETNPSWGAAAAVGLATILEKRGKEKEALDYLTRAALTGRMDKAGIAQFHSLYSKTHNGQLDGIEEYLDTRFRESYRNPVKGEKYRPEPARTDRVVLAEFFTGAGCVPCIPFDYAFETILEDYPRSDVALLVYHWHAPTTDPMGNHSSDARVKYFGLMGAPFVFLDGKKFDRGEDSSEEDDRDPNTARRVYEALSSQIRAGLKTPVRGRIKLDANREGANVKVSVAADQLKDVSPDITLHLALVEDEVHYSGENGLRFHPMVVRNLARQPGAETYGFKVDQTKSNKFDYVFDINDIVARNLRYYDEYPEQRKKELAERGINADDIGLDFSFKEHRHFIDPDHLSVVAFLQDFKTKEILQAAYLRLAATQKNVVHK